ncbi:OLC1v1024097C1 [Oldenlandia corymbosa var. corymbosa]|uniref:OLC1v1024097C1 n=1 Tax=Oldenlandia corymbosa var. corymbosa TaxID=529605 RepID=A0AAV1C217_OLDCO|nr:OLC1v1024097C1 [Oldenlandia corymbosa var. corymbosa]
MWQRIRANPIEWPVRYATRNLGIHFMPPGKVSIVERFGGYTKALTHGTHLLIPFVDRIVSVLSVEETSVPLFPIEASTWDSKMVSQDSVLQYRVFDPVMAANPDNPLRLLILFGVGKSCSSIRLITLDKVPETLHRINKEILNPEGQGGDASAVSGGRPKSGSSSMAIYSCRNLGLPAMNLLRVKRNTHVPTVNPGGIAAPDHIR